MQDRRIHRKYIVVLAVVSGLVLLVGSQFKPGRRTDVPVSQIELRRLQAVAQQRNLEELASFFSEQADFVRPALTWVRGVDASGVVWDDRGLIVSPAPDRPVRREPTAGLFELTAEVLSIHYPVAALRAPPDNTYRAPRRAPPESVAQGSWVISVTARQDGGYLHSPGTFQGMVAIQCGDFRVRTIQTNLPLDRTSAGGGIFDLAGNLLAVVLQCDDTYAAVAADSIDRILAEAESNEGHLLRRYGLRVEPIAEDLREYLGTDRGLLVTEVWNGWPADVAGLLPGDVIQGLDDAEVNTEVDLARLMLPVAFPVFDLWVYRDRRTVQLNLPASHGESPDPVPARPGIVLRSPEEGYIVEDVAPGSRAEEASIEPGDRLLRIRGRRPRSLAEAQRVLADEADEPVYVVIQRGPRKFGAYLR